MNRIFGMVMAAGLVLGHASVADAQISLSIGDPYHSTGLQVGQPYGYGYGLGGSSYGLGGSGTAYYGSGYSSYLAPGITSFVTGSYAPDPYIDSAPVYGVAPPVVVPYRTYGYRSSSYGYRRGFSLPFLGGRRW